MATLIPNADGSFTGASTFAASEIGTSALAMVRANTTTLGSNSNVSSPTFTFTSGKVVDGVLLWMMANQAAPAGTLLVELQKGGTTQASVTVNVADLPHSNTGTQDVPAVCPVFFKFTATATGDGGTNWTVKLTTSSASGAQITYSRNSATTGDFTRALRTTTSATIAAGDDPYIVGELTGAGTHNVRNVTMDSTAATAYGNGVVNSTSVNGGGVRASCYGNLSYGVTASTNYVLRVNGDVEIYWNGNVDVAFTGTVTVTIASPGVFTLNSHGFESNQRIRFRTTGALPTGLSANVDYYVVGSSITTNTFQVSATSGGSAVNTSGSQSGTHTAITGLPRSITAVLELQMASASGDFGIQVHGGCFNSMGLSRTSGKNVVKTRLTADLVSSSIINSQSNSGSTVTTLNGADATGFGLKAATLAENSATSTHILTFQGSSNVNNVSEVFTIWLARGSGTNNRFVRVLAGDSASATPTNGFFADVDLQAGTIGTCTAIGAGSASNATMDAVGGGYVIRIFGNIKTTGNVTPFFIIAACSAAGTVSYTGTNTQNLVFDHAAMLVAASLSDPSLTVADDTGWLTGDVIVRPSTVQAFNQYDTLLLSANAGSSSMTSKLYPFGTGLLSWVAATTSGTAPTQGEVINLTRNIKIRSTSNSLFSYVYKEANGTLNMSWTELYYIGSNTTNKRGIEFKDAIPGNANPVTLLYCSMHDCYVGLYLNAQQTQSSMSANLNCAYNVFFNPTSNCIWISGWTGSDWTLDNNTIILPNSRGHYLGDCTGTLTNNTVASSNGGSLAPAFDFEDSRTNLTLGTNSGNTVHSGTATPFNFALTNPHGSIVNPTAWRCSRSAIFYNNINCAVDFYVINPTIFGNISPQFLVNTTDCINIIGGTICGDATFGVATAIGIGSTTNVQLNIQGVDFVGGTGQAALTNSELNFQNTLVSVQGVMSNCKFGAPNGPLGTFAAGKAFWMQSSYVSFEKYNQTAGDHRTEMTYGQIKRDTAFFNSNPQSMRMTPISASFKLTSGPPSKRIKVPVSSGNAASISSFVYKSKTADGAAYNGNQPRLMVAANPAIGLTSDTVLATYSAGTGAWTQLSGTTPVANDNGAFEVYWDCDGTAGFVCVGDVQVA